MYVKCPGGRRGDQKEKNWTKEGHAVRWADGEFLLLPHGGLDQCRLAESDGDELAARATGMPTVGLGEGDVHCLDEYGY